TAQQCARLERDINRMLQYEPVQYILGEADFFGYKFHVSPAVLIPRPETEELVDWMIQDQKKRATNDIRPRFLDIGTGSGCIPIVLKKKIPYAELSGIDISCAALSVAAQNAARQCVEIAWQEMDILNEKQWGDIPNQHLSVIVSNPPYIPHRERTLMHRNVLEHEPSIALFVADEQPLLFYETIARFAQQKLQDKGCLYFECNEYNATDVRQMLLEKGYASVHIEQDMSGKDRMIRATHRVYA
ncbi:MAG: peptide chain release factor N(5)-glutamine methyltransferase, partial [Bacteroidota bacterium]